MVLAGCSGDDGGGDLAIDDLYSALLSKYCDVYVRCGILDRPTCEAALGSQFSFDLDVVGAVKAGKVIYHADLARTCIDSVDAGTCDRAQFLGASLSVATCDAVFEGTVHAGGECAIDDECISRHCDTAGGETCPTGTCAGDTPPVRGQIGSACETTSDCDDAYCDSTSKTCQAFLADGATCTSDTQCEHYYCMGTCQPIVDEGEACTSESQCRLLQDNCNSQHVCTSGVATGAACAASADCRRADYCQASTETCQPRPVKGQSCQDTQACLDGSLCDDTNTCVDRLADGEVCDVDSQCENHNCNGTCQPATSCF